MITRETLYWRDVLERLLAIVETLVHEAWNFVLLANFKLHRKNNGDFLGLVELLATLDDVLREHVRRVTAKKFNDDSLSNGVQNEIIQILLRKVQDDIVKRTCCTMTCPKNLDCPPSVARSEEMTVIVMFVNAAGNMEEHLPCFFDVDNATGKDLLNALTAVLAVCGNPFADCRGQGYDNSNREEKERCASKPAQ